MLGCFSFLFSFPLSRLLPSLKKGLRAGIGGYELHGRVISGEKKAERAVLGTDSHVSPYVTYKNCPFLPFLDSGGAAETSLPVEGGGETPLKPAPH